MAVALSSLVADTRKYLDEVSEADFKETDIIRDINKYYQEMVSAVVNVWEDFYLTPTTFNLVANQQEYGVSDGVPSTVYKVKRIEVNYNIANVSTDFNKAYPIEISAIKTQIADTNQGSSSQPWYYVYGFDANIKIGFLPIPTANGTSGVKLWYIQQVTNLVLTTDTCNIPYPDRYAPKIALAAAAEELRRGQQDEVAARQYLTDYQVAKDEMIQELRSRVADEPKVIQDNVGMDTDFGYHF